MISASLSLPDAGSTTWDAVVVGAGPAGAVAARELARLGRSVLLVDKSAFPRRKVCGCCLNGRALATLRKIGLGDLVARCGGVPLERLLLAAGSRTAPVRLVAGVGLSREALDAALVAAAVAAGAAFLPQTRAALDPLSTLGSPNAFALRDVTLSQRGLTGTAKARIVLAADGLGGALLARAGENTAAPEPGARIGIGAVVGEVPAFYQRGTIYMTCGARGYLGLVRLEDGTLDLAAAIDAAWLRVVGGPGAAATRLLSEAGWPSPPGVHDAGWRGTPPLTRRANRLASVRVFALGDAAGYVEPFTGEGMAWALAAAAAVAPLAACAAEQWDSSLEGKWTRTYRRVVRSRQLTCRLAAGALRHPGITRAAVALLSHVPRLAWPIVYHLNAHVARPTAFRV
jgi:flavin-dependent dehydrogenase